MIIRAVKQTTECTVYQYLGEHSIMIRDYHGEDYVLVERFYGTELIGENVFEEATLKSLQEAHAFLEDTLKRPITIMEPGVTKH